MSIEVNAYGTHYSHFTSVLYNSVRADTHLDDFGQNGWMTPAEHDLLIRWLELSQERTLLDVACGSGGPTLRSAERTGCSVEAIDVQESGIVAARARANELGLAERVNFHTLDAGCPLPFHADSFDSVICNDAINHLGNRKQVLAEWARVTRRGGLIAFSDPMILTGPVTAEEVRVRCSLGPYLLMPSGMNEQLLQEVGFECLEILDHTDNMRDIAKRWYDAREARLEQLREVEGDTTCDGLQKLLDITYRTAAERRFSRLVYRARRT